MLPKPICTKSMREGQNPALVKWSMKVKTDLQTYTHILIIGSGSANIDPNPARAAVLEGRAGKTNWQMSKPMPVKSAEQKWISSKCMFED